MLGGKVGEGEGFGFAELLAEESSQRGGKKRVFHRCWLVGWGWVLDVFVDGRIAQDEENERFHWPVVDCKKRRGPSLIMNDGRLHKEA